MHPIPAMELVVRCGDDDPCQQESDAEFCQRFNAECGTLVKIDNCGLERRVEKLW
jgi:hypothetical protein